MIILHPGSGSKRKVWPLERFSEVGHFLQEYMKSKIFVIQGPAEGAEVQKVFQRMNAPILVRGLSLLELGSVMEGCRCFIGNDSGISHLSAALGIPTIAIFGPTDRTIWSPRGKKVVTVHREIPCSPCFEERFFQCQHFDCLKKIDVEDVLEGLRRLGVVPLRS